jgi:hypothetical protein
MTEVETTIQNPEKHETVTADSQGRVNLGVQYAGRDIELVVVESSEHEPGTAGLQQPIDQPMTEAERKGMLFVRAFGIAPQSLKDDHDAATTDDGIDPNSVSPSDVDWSNGYLQEPTNVARFVFETEKAETGEDQFAFTEHLTAEPADVTSDKIDGTSVYRYENEHGNGFAIVQEFVERVEQLFGYDSSDDLSHVRVNPEEEPNPVMFRDIESEAFVAIAPRVSE